jgi:site-specific DNA recombinase
MSAAVIYTRVSTSDQVTEGVSLDAQRARAQAWAAGNGFEVHPYVFCDAGISGKRTTNRPELQRALDTVCAARGNALVVYSLSRLARSTRDAINLAERLAKAGCDLVSLTERIDTTSASGKLTFRLFAILSEFERDLVSERTRAALAHKAARGERVGQIPFGKRLVGDKDLVDNPAEQATMGEMATMRSRRASWRAIADDLNARGIHTKTGRRWTWQTCRKIGT